MKKLKIENHKKPGRKMNLELIQNKEIDNPPGGILMWIVIFLELLTFGIALVFMIILSKEESAVFHSSRLMLNPVLGNTNSVVLLTSGYFMAESVRYYRAKNNRKANTTINIAMLFGVLFLIIKGVEYYLKITSGISLSTNTFFSFYWLLTGFHYIHVIVGLVILLVIKRYNQQESTESNLEFYSAGATFWHMCDLIWIILFPILYLLF